MSIRWTLGAALVAATVIPAQNPAPAGEVRPPAERTERVTSRPTSRPTSRSDRWAQFAARHPEAAARILARADRNGDGDVDGRERMVAMEIWRQLRTDDEGAEQRIQAFLDRHPNVTERLERDGRIEAKQIRRAREVRERRRQ